MLIKLLDTAPAAPARDRMRIWMDLGQTVSLGNRCIATAENHFIDGAYRPVLVVTHPAWGRQELRLAEHPVFDLRRFSPLLLVPRALDVNDDGIADRFFLEFVRAEISGQSNGRKGA